MDDDDLKSAYLRFKGPHLLREWDRAYLLDQLASAVFGFAGSTAECGSYKGLSSFIICRRTQPGGTHHIFDSFEGLSRPDPADGTAWSEGDMAIGEDEVLDNLIGFDVRAHKGWIPERFSDVDDEKFVLVHIDVDLYQPTYESLKFFYDRVVRGGLIVCDDYGFRSCPGARRAVDEFLIDKSEVVLSIPTGQGVIIRGWPTPL